MKAHKIAGIMFEYKYDLSKLIKQTFNSKKNDSKNN